MLQKEINEIRRHLTGERCCIGKIYGCFVNQQKEIISRKIGKKGNVEEKKAGLSILMKTQTGKDFTFDDRMVSIVSVIKIDVAEYTAKERPRD